MSFTTVSDVMTNDVYTFGEDTSIEAAARVLCNRHIAGAPVVSEAGRPIGVVTLADLLDPTRKQDFMERYPQFYRAADNHLEASHAAHVTARGLVADVMSPFVLSIQTTATLFEAANRMISEQVHRLLVMDDGRLVGMVTSIDLLRGYVMQQRE